MQTIYLDISNKGVIPCIQTKQSEVGRKFLAVITDSGVPYNIPDNSLLSVWYEGDTDAGNYSSIEEKSAFSIDGNKVTVELVAQMLLKEGDGELCLSITHGDGGETNTWNIPYKVEYKPGAGSPVPTKYYTALTEAGAVAAKYAGEAKEAAESISTIFIESTEFPGCYYRNALDEQEWINPPMFLGVEYRTTERSEGNPVYAKRIAYTTTETLGNTSGLIDTVIAHGISNFDYAVRWTGRFGTYTLPLFNAVGGSFSIYQISSTAIAIRNYKETISPTTFYFDLYYTKTTD